MPNRTSLNFDPADNDLAYKLYQGLTAQGVPVADMDAGEGVINYTGKTCPDGASTCLIGAHDGTVTSSEVFEYALNNYEKYQKLIEGVTGDPLPWVLDDLNPETTFDAEVRAKVQAAIDKLKFTLTTAQGLKEGTEEYEEKLALGVFYLAAVPDKAFIQQDHGLFSELTTELADRNMGWFREYLRENGGFRGQTNYSEEYTALESIKAARGKCTSDSEKLFAFFKIAGFSPVFVEIPTSSLKTEDPLVNAAPRVRELINEVLENALVTSQEHVCIGLQIGGRFRLFDAALLYSDIRFQLFRSLTLRQFLGYVLSNRGSSWIGKGDLDRALAGYNEAIKINPQYTDTYSNRGVVWTKKGDLDRAVADFNEAIKIDPQSDMAYNNRGFVWNSKGEFDRAIADFDEAIKINPQLAMAYHNRGLAWVYKEEFDRAIADFNKAIKIDPQCTEAYTNREVALRKRAEKAETIKNDPQFATQSETARLKWQQDSLKEKVALFEVETGGADISKVEAIFIYSYSLWLAANHSKAREQLKILDGALSFKTPPSDSTKTFFAEMFRLMPTAMAGDPEVRTIVAGINAKLE